MLAIARVPDSTFVSPRTHPDRRFESDDLQRFLFAPLSTQCPLRYLFSKFERARGGRDCGYGFRKGVRYLVYAHRTQDRSPLCEHLQSIRDLWPRLAEDLEYFRNLPAHGNRCYDSRSDSPPVQVTVSDDTRFVQKPMEGAADYCDAAWGRISDVNDRRALGTFRDFGTRSRQVQSSTPTDPPHLKGYSEAES